MSNELLGFTSCTRCVTSHYHFSSAFKDNFSVCFFHRCTTRAFANRWRHGIVTNDFAQIKEWILENWFCFHCRKILSFNFATYCREMSKPKRRSALAAAHIFPYTVVIIVVSLPNCKFNLTPYRLILFPTRLHLFLTGTETRL